MGTTAAFVTGFGLRPISDDATSAGAVVRKPAKKESAWSGAPGSAVSMGDLAGADGAAGARWGREGAAESAKRADDGRNEPYGLGLADE